MNKEENLDKTSDLFAIRAQKLEDLKKQDQNPFEKNWEQSHSSAEVLSQYEENSEQVFSVAGRILAFRLMGQASFIKILDRDGKIQLYIKSDLIGKDKYQEFKKYDLGDIIGASGTAFQTKTGEITIRVERLELLAKSLKPLPEKWHGLVDNDQIYRQRYLDLIVNDESRDRFLKRSHILREIRNFFWARNFIEVETPSLQSLAGGASARPFTTHMNALGIDFYLRISLELYLKRMLIGGFDRVFEMGRVFRNEGLSKRHNPEFTLLEAYQAYTDFRGMMTLIYDLFQHICKTVLKSTQVIRPDGTVIEFGGKWKEISYKELIISATEDKDWFSRTKEEKLQKCKLLGIEVNPELRDSDITNDVFEKCVEPNLIQPTFVTHVPRELCPLAKINKQDSAVLDVFELCINGQEIAPAYSEQNDPQIQKSMFENQAGENIHNVDYDFLAAMEHGMPPAGGIGIGIDRLVSLLTSAQNIRETILFPTLKPQN